VSNPAIQILMKQALQHYETGDLQAAASACRDVLGKAPEDIDALVLLGSIFTDAGNYDQAIELFKSALVVGGPASGVLFNLGVAFRGAERLLEASRAFKNAAEAAPDRADCWYNLGEAYRRLERQDEALNALIKAAELAPDDTAYGLTLANAFLDAGKFDQAIEQFRVLTESDPADLNAQNGLGVALRLAGHVSDSEELFRSLSDTHPSDPATLNNFGLTLAAGKKFEDAEKSFLKALDNAPDYAEARSNLADIYASEARYGDAVLSLEIALKTDPDNRELGMKLALMYQKDGRLEDAKSILESLSESDFQPARRLLANVLRDMGDFEAAKALLQLAEKDPLLETHRLTNLGLLHLHEGSPSQAIKLFRSALNRDPENTELQLNLAHSLLIKGEMADGWAAFEGRLTNPLDDNLPGRPWSGENLAGKSILVTGEQGAGDCFQFVRYLAPLADLADTIAFSTSPRLASFLAESLEGVTVSSSEIEPNGFDYHVPLMSLPHVMASPLLLVDDAYLAADRELVRSWKSRLTKDGPAIGLAWQGNRAYETDYLRSISAAQIAKFVESATYSFVSLQRGGHEMLGDARSNVQDFTGEMDLSDGFVDTAALMMSLDLIITSDTSIAHLAGALGRPVWVLLNSAPDWRWQLERPDSPWYPTMRLFRQPKPRDWRSVFTEVEAALAETF